MSSIQEKKSILNNILESKEFKDSPVYANLLSYLVDSSLSENIPKEITIAIDVFGKDSSFNSNKDSSVRYHVHMLRKKLDEYYQNGGKADKVRVVIPKGHYEIKFVDKKNLSPLKTKFREYASRYWALGTIIVLIFLNAYLIYRKPEVVGLASEEKKQNATLSNDKIWSSFFENGYSVSVILGDDFLLDEFNEQLQRYRQIRDWEIDSENDLKDFLLEFPDQNLWKSEISGVPFGGASNLMDIFPVVYYFQNDISLRMSSKISLEEIRDHNIIYIGEFKNLRVLNKVLYKLPVRFQYHPDERLFILDENGDTLNTYLRIEAPYAQTDKYNVDYSLLIKMPGFAEENFMFVVGFGYGGRMERTKMLSDSELRTQLIEDIQKINNTVPEYFIVLFEVKSIERTGFTNEIKYFKEIPSDFLIH